MRKIIYGIIIGGLIFGSVVYATNIFLATDILYEKEDWEVDNVKEALDNLYTTLNEKRIIKIGSYSDNQTIDINTLNIVDDISILTKDNFLVVINSYDCASEGNGDGVGKSYTKSISKEYSNGILKITGAYANSLNDHGYNAYSYSIVKINYDVYLIIE